MQSGIKIAIVFGLAAAGVSALPLEKAVLKSQITQAVTAEAARSCRPGENPCRIIIPPLKSIYGRSTQRAIVNFYDDRIVSYETTRNGVPKHVDCRTHEALISRETDHIESDIYLTDNSLSSYLLSDDAEYEPFLELPIHGVYLSRTQDCRFTAVGNGPAADMNPR